MMMDHENVVASFIPDFASCVLLVGCYGPVTAGLFAVVKPMCDISMLLLAIYDVPSITHLLHSDGRALSCVYMQLFLSY